MLSSEKTKELISIITNSTESLSNLYNTFKTSMDVKNTVISLKYLSILLADGVLDHKQQIVTVWIIYKSFETENFDEHPFRALFASIYDVHSDKKPNTYSPELYDLLGCIITNANVDEIGEYSVIQILNSNFPLNAPDRSEVQIGKYNYTRISPLIIDQTGSEESKITQVDVLAELMQNITYCTDFDPPYIRPEPELSPIFEHELEQTFILSDSEPIMLFDENHSAESTNVARKLLARASKSPLSGTETKNLCNHISSDPLILDDFIDEKSIIEILDMNPRIIEMAIKTNAPKYSQYIDSILKVPLSDATTDVMQVIILSSTDRLTSLRAMCNSNIAAIRSARDNPGAQKIARPFCKLLTDLIKDGIKLDGTLTMTILSFCDDMRKRNIKEAGALQQILKTD